LGEGIALEFRISVVGFQLELLVKTTDGMTLSHAISDTKLNFRLPITLFLKKAES
jgi:hypothetical protein